MSSKLFLSLFACLSSCQTALVYVSLSLCLPVSVIRQSGSVGLLLPFLRPFSRSFIPSFMCKVRVSVVTSAMQIRRLGAIYRQRVLSQPAPIPRSITPHHSEGGHAGSKRIRLMRDRFGWLEFQRILFLQDDDKTLIVNILIQTQLDIHRTTHIQRQTERDTHTRTPTHTCTYAHAHTYSICTDRDRQTRICYLERTLNKWSVTSHLYIKFN